MYNKVEITSQQIDIMYNWSQSSKMKHELWYPLKSDEAYETFKLLIETGELNNIEMNGKELKIQKVHWDFPTTIHGKPPPDTKQNRGWYEKNNADTPKPQ